jgi:DNA-binding transcriptional ArsR family regulator
MARALADPWRVRILAELSVRPLSPSRFVEEVGGELTVIGRYFRQLEKWGYIELIEERPGRRRGAAIEHVYRGIERAYFNTSTWEGIPRSKRDQVSRAMVNSFVARVSEAIAGGTFDEELDRHLSWDAVALDRAAWCQLGQALDEILGWLAELEAATTRRLTKADRETIPAIVGLSAFRTPQSPVEMLNASRCHQGTAVGTGTDAYTIGATLAKALSNKWRCRILMELTLRPLSPSRFQQEFGGSKSHIARCFRELAEWGYVEVFEERRGGRRRGGVEMIYRNARRPYFDTPTWMTLPKIVREEVTRAFLGSYFQRVASAIDEDTFDAEIDRHFSWKPVTLDRLAWTEVSERLDRVLAWLPELEAESIERSEGNLETLIPAVVGLFSFRSVHQVKTGNV